MGDLISSSLLAGAAGRAAPSPGAVGARGAAPGAWVTTMWPPPAFGECPAFHPPTDDHVPNRPRRGRRSARGRPRPPPGGPPPLRLLHQRVQTPLPLGRPRAHDHRTRDVGAVAVHLGAKV